MKKIVLIFSLIILFFLFKCKKPNNGPLIAEIKILNKEKKFSIMKNNILLIEIKLINKSKNNYAILYNPDFCIGNLKMNKVIIPHILEYEVNYISDPLVSWYQDSSMVVNWSEIYKKYRFGKYFDVKGNYLGTKESIQDSLWENYVKNVIKQHWILGLDSLANHEDKLRPILLNHGESFVYTSPIVLENLKKGKFALRLDFSGDVRKEYISLWKEQGHFGNSIDGYKIFTGEVISNKIYFTSK